MSTITDWAADDRPREKMMAGGPAALSDAELLAILLRTGIHGQSAVDLARSLMERCHNSLAELGRILLRGDGSSLRGLGPAKACTITAALELGRRRAAEEEQQRLDNFRISTPRDLFTVFNQHLSDLDHEELWALYMSRSGKILQKFKVGDGGVDFAPADVRKVIRPAIEYMASFVALCHNHPHSVAQPSGPDLTLTRRLAKALELFDIRLFDHLIIADGVYYSMREHCDY